MKHWKNAAVLGGLMFVNYGLNAVSFRFVQHTAYLGVAVTDAALAWYGFTMVQYIGKAETKLEKIGYTIGGICGSVVGLWAMSHLGK